MLLLPAFAAALAAEPCRTLSDVAVFDTTTAALMPERQDVRTCGDRIHSIRPHGKQPPPPGEEILDGEGRTLLPGLIDVHTHIAGTIGPPWDLALPDVEANLQGWLMSGVTTILEVGGRRDTARWAAQTAADPTLGPAIVHAGIRLAPPSGHLAYTMRQMARDTFGLIGPLAGRLVSRPMVHVVRSARNVRSAIRRNIKLGARFTKLDVEPAPGDARGMPAELLALIASEAEAAGAPAIAHVGGASDTALALEAGVRIFAHSANTEALPDALIAALAAEDAVVFSTLILPIGMVEMSEGRWQPSALDEELGDAGLMARSSGAAGRGWQDGHRSITGWIEELSGGWAEANVSRMRAAGVTVLPGTDSAIPAALPGPSLHRELELLVQRSGYAPGEVLSAATAGAAALLGVEDLGRVEVGFRADLLVVEGDPTADIGRTADIVGVLRAGEVVRWTE
ncbi:MAG: imidazolonepropionase-like amidohydrolase [Myxococcota bacterium]|jgi:imidazolonepropionase-like amidohydrolase